jgi:hypothetical protein
MLVSSFLDFVGDAVDFGPRHNGDGYVANVSNFCVHQFLYVLSTLRGTFMHFLELTY